MSDSDHRGSFMLEEEYIPKLISFLTSSNQGETQSTQSYQKLNYEIDEHHIYVYNSGIVVIEYNEQIVQILQNFFSENNLENKDFQNYIKRFETEESKSDGWETTPKGIWLTDQQIQYLIDQYLTQEGIKKVKPEKHEFARYKQDNGTIVINESNIVYTIGGFTNFRTILSSTIEENNTYEGHDLLTGLDEQGRWVKIGGLALSHIELTPSDLQYLQLQGVKDTSLSRNMEINELAKLIEENSNNYNTLHIDPGTINNEISNREEYLQYLTKQYQEWISSIELDRTSYIEIDKQLNKLIGIKGKQISRDLRPTPLLGITSTLASAEIERWKNQIYSEYGVKMNRSNLQQIRDHPNTKGFGKLILI